VPATSLHADHVIRALDAGKHVLCELPLATTMADARRIVDAHAASDRQVFVDMFARFDPATQVLHTAIAQGSYGTLQTLTMELRTALLWEGYQLDLDTIAMDVLHSSLDAIVTALGRPASLTAMGVAKDTGGSAAEVLLGYPTAIVRCSASALLPKPYGVRGGYRAVCTDAAIESSWTAGYEGRPTTTLTEYTQQGQREVDLPARDAYTAVIDHVIACCQGRRPPASARPACSTPSSSPSTSTRPWLHPSGHDWRGGAWCARSGSLANQRIRPLQGFALQPVGGRETAMCLASPGIGSRGAVALQHRAGFPAGQAHQVRFTTAFRQPLVGKGVSQPVRVQAGQADLMAASFQHLRQPRGRQAALLAEPQPVKVRVWVTGTSPQVAVQRQCSRSAKRQRPLPAPLAEHQQHVQVEVHIR
jgi:Oxidoreductase family, NAD-binding Rossmann fold